MITENLETLNKLNKTITITYFPMESTWRVGVDTVNFISKHHLDKDSAIREALENISKFPKHLNPPDKCDLCNKTIIDSFYDARVITVRGLVWANTCTKCFAINRGNLGTGLGQKYVKFGDKFLKVAG